MTNGVVVLISSVAGNSGTVFTGGSLSYAVSKAALNKFGEELSMMVAPNKRVVTISPGYTLTKMWNPFSEKEKQEAVEGVPLKRFIKPEEIAHTVIAVLENDAITGQNIIVDAGLVLREIK
jgi:3-oxoacyl-[acyl-carrier protein] reductase